ncbi:MAG: tripartite tricarboxylate transporter substrate binding protein [Burkholderiales bacterium]|nr:tripartite tricarboxylate transporter substrate binding protein [Burkholderiales bacterium]
MRASWKAGAARIGRRLAAAVICAAGANQASAAAIDAYPARPIRYVVGGSVGGGADALARAVGQKLAERWGQQVIIDNRPGGGGIAGSEIVARSSPDGYTMLMAFTSHVTNPSLYPKLSYDTLKDFAPVTLIATIPNILVVHPSVPADSVQALIALAKARSLSFGSTGSGASTHLAGVLFAHMTGTKLLHVPYKGAGPAIVGVVTGESNMMFATMLSILPQVRSGKLRALAVTGARRSAAAPELPTISESGVRGYEANAWFATYVRSGTPTALLQKLNQEIVAIVDAPEMRKRLAAQGAEPATSTPEDLGSYTRSELERWRGVIRESGARAD